MSDKEVDEVVSRRARESMADPEIRQKISERTKEALADPEIRERISRRTREAMADPKIRQKISEAKKGSKRSEEAKRKTSETLRSKGEEHHTKRPDVRRKISIANKGKPYQGPPAKVREEPLDGVKCELCGKKFNKITTLHLRKKHGIEFDEYVERFPDSPVISESSKERYGRVRRGVKVSEEARSKMSEAKRGENNPHYGKERPDISRIMLDNNPMKDPEVRKRHLEVVQSKENRELVRKDTTEKLADLDYRDFLCRRRLESGPHKFKKGWYTSTKTGMEEHYDSSYELARFQQLDDDENIAYWSKTHHNLVVEYSDSKGKKRLYYPDIVQEDLDGNVTVEEVKGYDGPEDVFKHRAARRICRDKSWSFVVLYKEDIFTKNN